MPMSSVSSHLNSAAIESLKSSGSAGFQSRGKDRKCLGLLPRGTSTGAEAPFLKTYQIREPEGPHYHSIVVSRRFRNIVAVPGRNLHHYFAGLFDHGLTSQARVELQVGGHIETIGFVIVHLVEQLLALFHHDVTGGASAVSAAGVLQMQAEIHGHIEDRLRLAVVLVGKLAVFKLKSLVLGKEGDPNGIRSGSFHGCGCAALCFFVCHNSSSSLLTFNLRLRDGVRGLGSLAYIGGVHVLSLQRRAHRGFHHQLGQMHSSLVQGIDRSSNGPVSYTHLTLPTK